MLLGFVFVFLGTKQNPSKTLHFRYPLEPFSLSLFSPSCSSSMASLILPIPADISKLHLFSTSTSRPALWSLFSLTYSHGRCKVRSLSSLTNAVYTQNLPFSRPTKLSPAVDPEADPISALNERIRRDHGKRDSSRTVMDSEEADKYIQLVKEQQQRGLQKLRGGEGKAASAAGAGGRFSYKVDPYSLRSGDYVVHKKVGVGRFVSIKFDVPKGSSQPTEYVFIEYADGMAKLPLKQASRLLYRYNLYVLFILYPNLISILFSSVVRV